jgi:hypothetical protein
MLTVTGVLGFSPLLAFDPQPVAKIKEEADTRTTIEAQKSRARRMKIPTGTALFGVRDV